MGYGLSSYRRSIAQLLLLGATLLCAGLSSFLGLLFYVYYWQYLGLFNEEGRYFDQATAIVYDRSAFVLIGPAIAFLFLALKLGRRWWVRRRYAVGG